jgi:hypothetical protein
MIPDRARNTPAMAAKAMAPPAKGQISASSFSTLFDGDEFAAKRIEAPGNENGERKSCRQVTHKGDKLTAAGLFDQIHYFSEFTEPEVVILVDVLDDGRSDHGGLLGGNGSAKDLYQNEAGSIVDAKEKGLGKFFYGEVVQPNFYCGEKGNQQVLPSMLPRSMP